MSASEQLEARLQNVFAELAKVRGAKSAARFMQQKMMPVMWATARELLEQAPPELGALLDARALVRCMEMWDRGLAHMAGEEEGLQAEAEAMAETLEETNREESFPEE